MICNQRSHNERDHLEEINEIGFQEIIGHLVDLDQGQSLHNESGHQKEIGLGQNLQNESHHLVDLDQGQSLHNESGHQEEISQCQNLQNESGHQKEISQFQSPHNKNSYLRVQFTLILLTLQNLLQTLLQAQAVQMV